MYGALYSKGGLWQVRKRLALDRGHLHHQSRFQNIWRIIGIGDYTYVYETAAKGTLLCVPLSRFPGQLKQCRCRRQFILSMVQQLRLPTYFASLLVASRAGVTAHEAHNTTMSRFTNAMVMCVMYWVAIRLSYAKSRARRS